MPRMPLDSPLADIGRSLNHIGAAIAESIKHVGFGSQTPLEPLDTAMGFEMRVLRGHGQEALADALEGLRAYAGAQIDG